MAEGKVVNVRNTNKYDVYIGRANSYKGLSYSKWGNPFVLVNEEDREEVLRKYKEYILKRPELMAALPELRGKVLACWCAPKRCHGDILLELLEEMDAREKN